MFYVTILDECGRKQFTWQRKKPFMNGYYAYRWERTEDGDIVLIVETVHMYKVVRTK